MYGNICREESFFQKYVTFLSILKLENLLLKNWD